MRKGGLDDVSCFEPRVSVSVMLRVHRMSHKEAIPRIYPAKDDDINDDISQWALSTTLSPFL